MKAEIIKSVYPKAYEQLGKYVAMLVKNQGGMSAEIAQAFPIDAAILMMFSSNQALRSLYDFFDGYQIHMFPMGSIDWVFRVVDPKSNHNNSENDNHFKTRSEAEEDGFEMCFKLLEQKLS